MNGENRDQSSAIGRLVLLMSRREVLRAGAVGVGAAAIAGFGLVRRAGADTPTPSLTEGPYWVEEQLNRSDVRSDPGTGVLQAGLPLRLMVNVSRLTSGVPSPLSGAWVDIWHCNAAGAYSDVSANGTLGQKWLRGYQVTDSHGNARFTTVYPGWYQGRAVHIHARVRRFNGTATTLNYTTQFFFVDSVSNAIYHRVAPYTGRPNQGTLNTSDGIYNSAGSQMILRMADDGSHAIASFNIKLNVTGSLVYGIGRHGEILPNEEDHADEFGGGTPSKRLLVA